MSRKLLFAFAIAAGCGAPPNVSPTIQPAVHLGSTQPVRESSGVRADGRGVTAMETQAQR